MKLIRHSILCAAALLAVCGIMSSCGDAAVTETPKETQAPSSVETAEAEETIAKRPASLPSDLDLGGMDINIWYFTTNSDAAEHFVDLKGDVEGDIVEVALYERNLFVEEELNCKLNYDDPGIASSDVGSSIRKALMSGDTTYDLYNVIQWNCSKLALEHCFLNVSDSKYLDLSQPWWSKNYINALAIGSDNVYFLAGDISLDMIRCIGAMYYNKQMYANLFDNADGLYDIVLDGKWTLDSMHDLIKEGYSDLNGNGKVDDEDCFGFMTNNYNNIDNLSFGAGAKLTRRDADNYPYITCDEEHNIEIYTKLYEICIAETSTLSVKGETTKAVQGFINGKTLLIPGFLYTSENLRDMKDDYGIIPFPKYDESQEAYISSVHDIATLMCLPSSCTKVDQVSAVLEEMAYYSYYNVTAVYYETALKTKYSRDSISSSIVDIIHDSAMTDLAYVYSDSLAGAGMVFRTNIAANVQDFTSKVAKSMKSFNKNMDKLISKFDEQT